MDSVFESPAALSPSGTTPNFDNPPNDKARSISIQILWAAVCSVLCAIRLYTRVFLLRRFTLEDWAITFGWCIFIGFCVFHMLFLSVCAGIQQRNLRIEDISKAYFYMYIASLLNICTLLAVKSAILLQYLEVFAPQRLNRVIYWSCHVLIWTNIVFYFTLIIMSILRCNPIPKAWNAPGTQGSCFISLSLLGTIVNSISIASNFVILVLPQVSIWRMQMAYRAKMLASIVFLVAVLALASSIVRLLYFIPLVSNPSNIYQWYTMGVWTVLEAVSAFAVACVPVLPRFFKGIREKIKQRRSASSSTTITSV